MLGEGGRREVCEGGLRSAGLQPSLREGSWTLPDRIRPPLFHPELIATILQKFLP